LLAVGGSDGKVYLYSSSSLKPHSTPSLEKNRGVITALAFSPDGAYLAAGDSNGKIIVYDMPFGDLKTTAWAFHTAKISSIAWAPSSKRAVSGSLDTNVYVWNIVKPMKNIAIKGAHAGGVSGTAFLDEDTVVSVGADAAFRSWKIKHHAV
jgi:WD40 repeat protein